MSGSALSDLSSLLALSRANELDLRPVILRVQTDLFVTAAHRDKSTIAAFEALASGLLPVVDDDTAAVVARKLAPFADTPESILTLLVERGGEARGAVIEGARALDAALIATASRDGADFSALRAARADLDAAAVAELVSREDAAVDAALARNEAIAFSGISLEALIERARENTDLAKTLLTRADLPPAHRAALYLAADDAQRAAIRSAVEPLAKLRFGSSPMANREASEALVDLSMAGDRDGFADNLAATLRLDRKIEWGFARDDRRDLLGLALLAAGVGEEDAIRIILTLEPEIARSVTEVFRLVHLFRQTPRATAKYLIEAIVGAAARPRASRHVPHLQAADRPGARDSSPGHIVTPDTTRVPRRA
jgi:Uncharacterised protein conserved in bacteria (DUF2336)